MRVTRDNGRPVIRHRSILFHAKTVPLLDPGWEAEFDALFDEWARFGQVRACYYEEGR